MTHDDLQVSKTAVTLADGRALTYFGAVPERAAEYLDRRQLAAVHVRSQARWDQLLGEWVVIASHRQDRTFQPEVAQCPLCPSTADSLTEIPAADYEVVVFENRFPALGAQQTDTGDGDHRNGAGRLPDDFALHLELFTIRRAPGKLKYLAGSESGMGAFANDIAPEAAARRLRALG
jgi:galactose-1-phosphate uridylyltransferase